MATNVPISVVILTLNEEKNLPRCLDSLAWCDDVIVVDSNSSDGTQEIARAYKARVFCHSFAGFGDQRNWALDNCSPKHPWILILDADERISDDLVQEFKERLAEVPSSIGAFRIRRRLFMWGRWLRHSSLYPTWVVRLVHRERVRYENRGHAETQHVKGEIDDLSCDLIDENLKGIDEWFERQNRYATQEAAYELSLERGSFRVADLFSRDPLKRRATLKRVASRLPARALLYFLYSFVLRKGFLDGRDGYVFCVMRACYQAMVAAKKHDMKRVER